MVFTLVSPDDSEVQERDMSPMIRILVVDDHPLMRAGITAEIDVEEDMQVVASAQNGAEALALFRTHSPDVSLIDLRMPILDGMSLIKSIRTEQPTARIIVLTTSAGDVHIVKAFRAGASGYLLKHMLSSQLIHTIRSVHNGERIIPEEIARLLAENALSETVTPREIEVLARVSRGFSNREIAAELFISEYTVKAHVKTIMIKLGANDRTHAVMLAMQRGFLDMNA